MDRLKEKELKQDVLREEQKQKDIIILKSLYNGNHLNNDELERANKLLYLLNISIKERLK